MLMHESLVRLENMLTELGATDRPSPTDPSESNGDADGGKLLFPHEEGLPDAKSAGIWHTTCILC